MRSLIALGMIALAGLIALPEATSLRAQNLPAVAQWKEYHSKKWDFCAAYPFTWKTVELFDGDQLRSSPANGGGAPPVLILAAFKNAHTENEKFKSLEDVAEDYEDDLRDQMVEDLSSTNSEAKVAGLPALTTTRAFLLDGRRWRARELRVERPDHVIVEIFLRAPESEFSALLKLFNEMVDRRLRPQCASK